MYDIIFISANPLDTNYKEFKKRYPISKHAKTFRQAQKVCLTDFFWAVWDDIVVLQSFDFDYIPDDWSKEYIHIFLNKDSYDGVCLVPKHAIITDNEINHRFFVKKKQVDILASTPKTFDLFLVDSYKDYLDALENTTTEMFWTASKNVLVSQEIFEQFYISHHDNYDRNENHAFIHREDDEDLYNGLWLLSKHKPVTQKEIEFKHLVNRKEINVIGSIPKPYDVVFISYQEPNADVNYNRLLEKRPDAKRVHGVKGIHQAHIAAAKLCGTDMFWIVDGDAEIVDDFDFDFKVHRWEKDIVHVWRSQNPINDLVYGYGGIKLFPRDLTINMDITKPDMTTSISNRFRTVDVVSNITAFNTDPFNTWKSAFRECVKLSSNIIDRQKQEETYIRLNTWCTLGNDRTFGDLAISGANFGRKYGESNKGNTDALRLINDFDWLKEQFYASNI